MQNKKENVVFDIQIVTKDISLIHHQVLYVKKNKKN